MANEITVTARLRCVNGGYQSDDGALPVVIDQSAIGAVAGAIQIGTTEETIDLTELTSPGWAWLKNLDATNFVKLWFGTTEVEGIRLQPGESCLFRLSPTAVLKARADTAACKIQYTILEG